MKEEKMKVKEPLKTNSTVGTWYAFIMETIVNFLVGGFPVYRLTEKEINKKETPKDIFKDIIISIIVLIIAYLLIKYIK